LDLLLRGRPGARRLVGGGVGIAIAVVAFAVVLPRIADYRDVWDAVSAMSWEDLAALGAATVVNLATFAPPWMAALPGLRFRQAMAMTQASTALATVAPAGAAVGVAGSFAMLRTWGFASRPTGLAVAVVGVWNQLANLTFPVVALGLLVLQKQDHPLLRTVAIVGLAGLVVVLAGFALGLSSEAWAHKFGDWAARQVGRVRRKPVGWSGASFARFRLEALHLLRRRWHVLTLATLVGHLTVFVLLLVSLRAVGVPASDVTAVEAFAAWALMRLIGAFPITPAGVGIVEVGLTTVLVGFGGDNADVVAAVLIYRVLTVLPTLLLGGLAFATWRRHAPSPAR
jgi:putative heme transporter